MAPWAPKALPAGLQKQAPQAPGPWYQWAPSVQKEEQALYFRTSLPPRSGGKGGQGCSAAGCRVGWTCQEGGWVALHEQMPMDPTGQGCREAMPGIWTRVQTSARNRLGANLHVVPHVIWFPYGLLNAQTHQNPRFYLHCRSGFSSKESCPTAGPAWGPRAEFSQGFGCWAEEAKGLLWALLGSGSSGFTSYVRRPEQLRLGSWSGEVGMGPHSKARPL